MGGPNTNTERTNGLRLWRAGCVETRTSGSEGGLGKPTEGNPGHGVPVRPYTEVRSREGVVYVAFVQDAGTRNILGFNVRTSRPAELVETALEQAVHTRSRLHGRHWLSDSDLICHSDQGSQFTSIPYSRKLREYRIRGSMRAVGTSADNALMESTIGLYKTELIYRRSWRSRQEIETATAAWVTWFNQKRLHSKLGHKSPARFEKALSKPGTAKADRVRENRPSKPERFPLADCGVVLVSVIFGGRVVPRINSWVCQFIH